MNPFVLFSRITRKLATTHPYLQVGWYLSSPSLEYKGRAFACFQDGYLNVKYNDEHELAILGVKASQKSGRIFNIQEGRWIQVPFYYHTDWEKLTELALSKAKEDYG